MAYYDIFRQEIARKHWAFGHALWEPDPGNLYESVAIGDVGYIRQGKFHRIFNVLLPEDDPTHENFGTPEYHEPLELEIKEHIETGTLSPNVLCSGEVKLVSGGLNILSSRPGGSAVSAQASYECFKSQGALLSIPVPARREDTVARGQFRDWMIKHIDSWFSFARSRGMVEYMEEIVLVTGCHRTRSYTNILFSESRDGAQVSLSVRVGSSGADITWGVSHESMREVLIQPGPSGDNLPENQCIFVRGFHVARFMGIFPARLRAAAGPAPLTGSDSHNPPSDKQLISTSIPEYNTDPLYVLLRYIAEKEPDSDMFLVHDDDLECIGGEVLGSLQPDTLMDYLRNSQLKTQTHGCEYLGRPSQVPVKVGMLSERALSMFPGSKPLDTPLLESAQVPSDSIGSEGSTSYQQISSHVSPTSIPTHHSQPHHAQSHYPHHARTHHSQPHHAQGHYPHHAQTHHSQPHHAQPHHSEAHHAQGHHPQPHHSQAYHARAHHVQSHPAQTVTHNLLTDGYIPYTFTPRVAEFYLVHLLFKVPHSLINTIPDPNGSGAYFVFNQPSFNTPPHLIINGEGAWVLDYNVRTGGSVVPQELWFPQGEGDRRRYVEQAQFRIPVFFVGINGSLGVPVLDAAEGHMQLRDAYLPPPLQDKTTVKIRIAWSGYRTFEQQVQLRDQTHGRKPIAFERFVKHVASRVRHFLAECERDPVQHKWRVGNGNITSDEVMLIGIVQVSESSWMPILQLTRRIVI